MHAGIITHRLLTLVQIRLCPFQFSHPHFALHLVLNLPSSMTTIHPQIRAYTTISSRFIIQTRSRLTSHETASIANQERRRASVFLWLAQSA